MNRKCLLVLPLIFLGAAAMPSDCGPSASVLGTDTGATVGIGGPAHLHEGATTDGYAAIRQPDASQDCERQLPTVGNPASLRNPDEDVMHGLPSSDVLAPINKQRQAPMFR